MTRNYSDEEVEAIFRRALERQVEEEDGYGHEELVAAAREVGLDDDAIDRTLLELDEERGEQTIRDRLHEKAKRQWLNHFVTYLVVAGGFLGMHALGFTGAWAIWMAFGWGMGVALQTFSTFRGPTDEQVDKERKKLNRKARRVAKARARRDAKRQQQHQRAQKRARRQRTSQAGDELERVIEEGVSLLLGAAAKKLREASRQMQAPAAPPRTEFEKFVSHKKSGGKPKSTTGNEREVVVTPPPRRRTRPKARVEVDSSDREDDEVELERRKRRGSRRK